MRCSREYQSNRQPLAIYDTPLNHMSQLTSEIEFGHICLLILSDGQWCCSGLHRYRMGGHAMLPRANSNGRRIIKIGTIVDGAVDAPFCGQQYYKPCATMKYAMTLIESIGPYIEFQFGGGQYDIDSSMVISYPGTVLRGNPGSLPTTWKCSQSTLECITISASSVRIIDIAITGPTLFSPMTINSRLMDIALIRVHFFGISNATPLSIASSSTVSILDSAWTNNRNSGHGGCIAVYSATIILDNCSFKDSIAHSDGGAIFADGSEVIINNCTFINCDSENDGGNMCYSKCLYTIVVNLCACNVA
jgi:hypothetical protein